MEGHNRIAPELKLGVDVKPASFINPYGCAIGVRSKVGAFVEIRKGASIGADRKISGHTFICEGVKIADECFIGHSVTFINDKYPRSTNADGSLQTEADWAVESNEILNRASIGSGFTLLTGVSVGEGEIRAGNSARFIRKVEDK